MPQFSRPAWPAWSAWSAWSAWGTAAAVAAFPTLETWRERLDLDGLGQDGGGGGLTYGYVCPFDSGTTTSPFALLRADLEAVREITLGWAVPTLVILLGLLLCLARRDPEVMGRRAAGLVVLIAAVDPLASLYVQRGICWETVPPFGAEWFGGVAEGWGVTQLCLLVAAALVLAASRATRVMRPVTADEPDEPDEPDGSDGSDGSRAGTAGRRPEPEESQAGMTWRRPAAGLVDYLIIASVPGAVTGLAWLFGLRIGTGFRAGMGVGFLERTGALLLGGDVELVPLVAVAGAFLYFWVQHTLWGRTPGKRLLGVRVVDARTGGRPGAGRTALRTLAYPVLVLVPGAGPWWLLVNGMWTLLDPKGRVLYDRLLGVAVVRGLPETGETRSRAA